MLNGTINFITAWLSVVLMVLVSIIWILRLLVKNDIIKKGTGLFNLNRKLRIHHKSLGIALIISSLIHGIVSSQNVLDLNLGSITFFLIVLMGASFFIRSKSNRKIWLNVHRVLVVTTILALILHLTDVGIQGVNLITSRPPETQEYSLDQEEIDDVIDDIETPAADDENTETTSAPDENGNTVNGAQYQDGVYTGVADGFGSDLTVEVTITNSQIVDITVVSHNEKNESYYGVPMEVIPQQIIDTQSVEVDTISGATYTSVGLKNAVIDALSKAIVSGDLPQQEEIVSSGRKHGH